MSLSIHAKLGFVIASRHSCDHTHHTHIRVISMVDFTFFFGEFSDTQVLITPISDKARSYFNVGVAVHSWYIPKSALHDVLVDASKQDLSFVDDTLVKIPKA